MDSINQINGTQGIQSPMNTNSNQIRNQEEHSKQPPPPPFNVEITQLGQLFSAIEESGELAKNELKQFHESVFGALQSGNFDAKTLFENASDEIKTIAEEAGIDLMLALTEFSEQAEQMIGESPQGPPPGGKSHPGPPPPPPDELLSSSEDAIEEDYSSLTADD